MKPSEEPLVPPLGPDPAGDLAEARELARDLGLPRSESSSRLEATAQAWTSDRAFEALSTVASRLTGNLDFASLVREILSIAVQSLEAERGIVFLGQPGDACLVPVAALGIGGQELQDVETISQTILSRAHGGQDVVTPDATRDPRLRNSPSLRRYPTRSVICLPLQREGVAAGVIYVDSPGRSGAFPEHAHRFMRAFASLAAVALSNAERHGQVLHENAALRERLPSQEQFGGIVTVSACMHAAIERATAAAQVDLPVLLVGESGTGKELLARGIHAASARRRETFLAHNCAAIPRELTESIVFGAVKGAYTGAHYDTPGLFRLAHKGTLFFDELAELDLDVQSKLLRVLEDGQVRPLGDRREHHVDVRLITATHRDLREAVAAGRFRQDLYYRANVLLLRVPPLRERADDVPLLVRHFVQKHRETCAAGSSFGFKDAALARLREYSWPGNVRELENLVQRAMVFQANQELNEQHVHALLEAELVGGKPLAPAPGQSRPPTLEALERAAIEQALRREDGNKTEAAKLLGLHRNALLRRIKKLGLPD